MQQAFSILVQSESSYMISPYRHFTLVKLIQPSICLTAAGATFFCKKNPCEAPVASAARLKIGTRRVKANVLQQHPGRRSRRVLAWSVRGHSALTIQGQSVGRALVPRDADTYDMTLRGDDVQLPCRTLLLSGPANNTPHGHPVSVDPPGNICNFTGRRLQRQTDGRTVGSVGRPGNLCRAS